jgi:3-deoxy-D-manno-octulosonic-acid transferase
VLSILYNYADAAFIGGSFKINVHNVLEAAVYGVPVLFGPKIDNSQEAKKLVEVGGGIIIKDKKEFYRVIRKLFSDDKLMNECGKISYDFVHKNVGTTDRIIKEIFSD